MTLTSVAVKTGIATIALTAMGLVAAAPASAHTSNMYTYVQPYGDTGQAGFATYGKSDAVVTALPTTTVQEPGEVLGIEVAGENGTAIADWEEALVVFTWNHTTGVRTPAVLTNMADASIEGLSGLDTLNDGTTVTVVKYSNRAGTSTAVASVNSSTGELVPLVDITAALPVGANNKISLATDPATGVTYVFVSDAAGKPHFLAVNVAAKTVGAPVPFNGAYFVQGVILGADFDAADGSLYFNYQNSNHQQDELTKIGAPSTWPTADPTYISSAPAPAQYGEVVLARLALTIEPTATAPALAATGSELPILAIVLVGTVAVLAGGVTVMVARRRSEAGTV
jgi:hypothetical protein